MTTQDSIAHTQHLPADSITAVGRASVADSVVPVRHSYSTAEKTWQLMPDSFMLYQSATNAPADTADLHRYLHDCYFSADSIFLSEVKASGYGVAGDPVPNTLRHSNMLTLILLFCFMLFIVSVANSKHFLALQLKNFFRIAREDDEDDTIDETSGELRFQLFLAILCSLLIAITAYLYATSTPRQAFLLDNDYQLVAVFFAATIAYFLLKWLLQVTVNGIFFNSKKNLLWMKSQLTITAAEGIFLFPAVILQIYFDISMQSAAVYAIFTLFLAKMLTFYKCWAIFFRLKGGLLQTFLYLCTLEIWPMITFAGLLTILIDVLKINF